MTELPWKILQGNCLEVLRSLPDGLVQTVITSPPYYGLRDYGNAEQVGMEQNPDCLGWATGEPCGTCYICHMVSIFREIRRVLRDDGTIWLNIGDSFWGGKGQSGHADPAYQAAREAAGVSFSRPVAHVGGRGRTRPTDGTHPVIKPKDLILIPSRLALALQADGWYVRSDIVWSKRSPMPESVEDRPTRSHEFIFLLTKSRQYYYNVAAVREPFESPNQGRDGGKRGRQRNRGGRKDGFTQPNGIDPSANGGRNRRSVWLLADRAVYPQPFMRSKASRPTSARPSLQSVWHLSPTPFHGAHFATFPRIIPELCIKAGTSAHGCCAICGAPWKVYRSSWIPTCACGCETVQPCIVLDPFCGAATTLLMATRLGRHSIGIELNPEYVELGEQRLKADMLAGFQRSLL
jgi:DNA modification methylase